MHVPVMIKQHNILQTKTYPEILNIQLLSSFLAPERGCKIQWDCIYSEATLSLLTKYSAFWQWQ